MVRGEKLGQADFTLIDEAGSVGTKAGIFYAATYGANKAPVTLLVGRGSPTAANAGEKKENQHQAYDEDDQELRNAFSLCPVTKFTEDTIPSKLMPKSSKGTALLPHSILLWPSHHNLLFPLNSTLHFFQQGPYLYLAGSRWRP
jgi:hypothetical protein